jgi:hypothetical protein
MPKPASGPGPGQGGSALLLLLLQSLIGNAQQPQQSQQWFNGNAALSGMTAVTAAGH